MPDSSSLSGISNPLLRNKPSFVPFFISHKWILNEITCVQSCIWSTVTPACLVRRSSLANADPSKYLYALGSVYVKVRYTIFCDVKETKCKLVYGLVIKFCLSPLPLPNYTKSDLLIKRLELLPAEWTICEAVPYDE